MNTYTPIHTPIHTAHATTSKQRQPASQPPEHRRRRRRRACSHSSLCVMSFRAPPFSLLLAGGLNGTYETFAHARARHAQIRAHTQLSEHDTTARGVVVFCQTTRVRARRRCRCRRPCRCRRRHVARAHNIHTHITSLPPRAIFVFVLLRFDLLLPTSVFSCFVVACENIQST